MPPTVKKTVMLIALIFLVFHMINITAIILISNRKNIKKDFFDAISICDKRAVIEILDRYPNLVNEPLYFLPPIDTPNESPLHTAIRTGDIDLVKTLVERGAKVNDRFYDDYPLNRALDQGKLDIAWYLIEQGADLTTKNGFGEPVIYCAVAFGPDADNPQREELQFELVKYIIDQHAWSEEDRTIDGGYTRTLLGAAAFSDHAQVVEYLLEKEFYDVDEIATDAEFRQTALIVAAMRQSYHACQILLDYGADKTIVDAYGKNAMDYAVEMNDERLIAMLSQ